jgi:hypothetical protein
MVTHPKGKVAPKRGFFRMPVLNPNMSKAKMSQNGRMANIATTLSSDQRIIDQTPCLKELYEFLEASKKRVP